MRSTTTPTVSAISAIHTRRPLAFCVGAGLFWSIIALFGADAQSATWPSLGPEPDYLKLRGHVDTLPDFVGPIDGSAKLTIFTEGNHFPVLLPLVFKAFPEWCRSTRACQIEAPEILVATLPQPMVVEMLLKGGIMLGSALLPVGRNKRVYPHFVMAGLLPLKRLAAAGIIQGHAVIFAHHRGLGLLVRRDLADIKDLTSFAARVRRVVLASDSEPGARSQYLATLQQLIGSDASSRLLAREISGFEGRIGVQHRDVPYALLNDFADGGIIFGHLADFYARTYPDQLRFIPVSAAAPFGQDIAMAPTIGERRPIMDAFSRFFLETARAAYPEAGFSPVTDFTYALNVDIGTP
jgi:hypothetical protein